MSGTGRITGVGASGSALVAAAILLFQMPQAANADAASLTNDTLLDRVKIEDMMIEYYTVLSSENHNSLGGYFTENAELDLEKQVFRGRDAIQKLYTEVRDSKLVPGTHNSTLLNNPRISIHGNTAEMDAIWTVVLCDVLTAPPRLIEHGTDHAEFVKENGRWLIRKRIVVTYSGG